MLKKLLKYDLEDMYILLVIFYVLAIVFAIFTRIFFSIDNSTIFNILGYIASGTLISIVINIVINNLMRVWVLFVKTMYGDQSYLTHTLPIEKKTIYLSKILSSIIAMFSSGIIIFICLVIAYYSKELLSTIKDYLHIVSILYDSNITILILAIFFVLFLELVFALLCGINGIVLGHRSNNKKIIKSLLFGFGYYGVFQVGILIMLLIISLFNSDIMNLFITNDSVDFSVIKIVLSFSILVYSSYIVISYIFGKKMLEKGVNVE